MILQLDDLLHRQQTPDQSACAADELLLQLPGGALIVVPRDIEKSHASYILLESGDWYEDEIRFLRLLGSSELDTVVDLHSGPGVYALSLAHAVKGKGRLLAIETRNDLHSLLQKSLEINDLSHSALSRELSPQIIEDFKAPPSSIDLLLIHEQPLASLQSCESLLVDTDPLIMLTWPDSADEQSAILAMMAQHQFHPYHLIGGLNLLAPSDNGSELGGWRCRIFFCKPTRAQQLEHSGWLLQQEAETVQLPDTPVWTEGILRDRNYATRRINSWSKACSPSDSVSHILNTYTLAHDKARPPAERYGYLNAAMAILSEIEEIRQQPLMLITGARIAQERGWTPLAADMLERATDLLYRDEPKEHAHTPFLTAAKRYDGERVSDDMLWPWLYRQTVAQHERVVRPTAWLDTAVLQQATRRLRQAGVVDRELFHREAVALKRARHWKWRDIPIQAMVPSLTASSLPDAPDRCCVVLLESNSSATRQMILRCLHAEETPDWIIALIPDGPDRERLTAFCEELDALHARRICALPLPPRTLDVETCDLLTRHCCQYHTLEENSGEHNKAMLQSAETQGLALIHHRTDPADAGKAIMLFDRLTPDMWRMLKAYYDSKGGVEAIRELTLAVPDGEDREKITSYLETMHQAEAMEKHRVRIVADNSGNSQDTVLFNFLQNHGALHVPTLSTSLLQKQAVHMARRMGIHVTWHNEQPVYTPKPLTLLKDNVLYLPHPESDQARKTFSAVVAPEENIRFSWYNPKERPPFLPDQLPPVQDFRVTIVLTTYNRAELLKRAVESILKQTYEDIILVICDDASTDGTEQYCRKLQQQSSKVIYRRNEVNLGPGLNGAAKDWVETELIMEFTDDDFLIDPTAIERMVGAFREHPYIGMAFGQCYCGDVYAKEAPQAILPMNCTRDCVLDPQQMLLDSIAGNHIYGAGQVSRLSPYDMAIYGLTHWSKEDIGREGDYAVSLLQCVLMPIAYVHAPTVYYSLWPKTISSSQLGGGWSMHIRLRTVALLDDMYNRHFGPSPSEDKRIQQMATQFEQQLTNLRSSLSKSELTEHEDELARYEKLIASIRKHEFPKELRTSTLL